MVYKGNDTAFTYQRGIEFYESILVNPYNGKVTGGERLIEMNYDIHVGAIAGLPGKILAFIISLICACLPVTGFYVWWAKRKNQKETADCSFSYSHRRYINKKYY